MNIILYVMIDAGLLRGTARLKIALVTEMRSMNNNLDAKRASPIALLVRKLAWMIPGFPGMKNEKLIVIFDWRGVSGTAMTQPMVQIVVRTLRLPILDIICREIDFKPWARIVITDKDRR